MQFVEQVTEYEIRAHHELIWIKIFDTWHWTAQAVRPTARCDELVDSLEFVQIDWEFVGDLKSV